MSREERKLRVGLATRDVVELWSEHIGDILDSADTQVSQPSERVWHWSVESVEDGRVEIHDGGEGVSEVRLAVERSDEETRSRVEGIIDRFSDLASGDGLDPAVVAADPGLGHPPEENTDADQPL